VPDPPAGALAALLEGTCRGEGWHVADALSRLAAEVARPAVEPLVALIRKGDPACRTWGVIALARIDMLRGSHGLDTLRAALAAEDWDVRNAAAWSLLTLGAAALPALPDLERAAATDPDLAYVAQQLGYQTVALHGVGFADLRLAMSAVVDGAGGRAAAVVLPDGRLSWVAAGDRFLDGEILRVEADALVAGVQRVRGDFSLEAYEGRLELFPDGTPAVATVDPAFVGAPIDARFDGDLYEAVLAIAHVSGLQVIVTDPEPAPVRLAVRDAPWDAVLTDAVAAAGRSFELVGRFLHVGRGGQPALALPQGTWTGQPVNVTLRLVEVADLLRTLGRLGEVEIEATDPPRHRRLTVLASEVPWDEVLTQVAAAQGWSLRREGARVRLLAGPRP
jgi:hypothetical protein